MNRGLVDLVVTACRQANFEPIPGPPYLTLQDTLASIGTGKPSWTVMYASHARQLKNRAVEFLPFRAPGLVAKTAVVVHATSPSPWVGPLLRAAGDRES